MNKRKKAFTLVELLVVIAILAILAVVAIIGFSGYTKKAKLSNDISLITQLNSALAYEASLGTVPKNMWEAKELLIEDTGYDISRNNTILTQYANIGYDVRANCVVLISNLTNPDTTKTIIECPEGYTPYSTYDIFVPMNNVYDNLYSTYLVDTTETEFDTNKGIDVGDCSGITLINYEYSGDSRDIVLRTNSLNTKLTIDDSSNGRIDHFGVAGYLNVIECATQSYHECGYIPQGQITKGRIVNEVYNDDTNKGELLGLHSLFLVASDISSFNQIIVGSAKGADVPDLDRTDVNIPAKGVLVVELQTGITSTSIATDEYIYLTKAGVIEQVVVNDKGNTSYSVAKEKDVSSDTTGVVGKINSTVTASEQIANIYGKNAAGTSYVDNNGDDITLSELITSGVRVDSKPSISDVEDNELFTGGAGTERNPYLISNAQELRNISEICYEGANGNLRFKYEEVFYKVVEDFSTADLPAYTEHGVNRTEMIYTWYPALPNINLDLNGHTISGINRDIIGYTDNANIHDGTLSFISETGKRGCVVSTVFGDRSGTIVFENLTLTGTLSDDLGAHYGPLVSFAYGLNYTSIKIIAKNITSSLRISNKTSGAYTGGLFGYVQGSKVDLEIKDCTVSGIVQSPIAGGIVGGCTGPKSTICTGNVVNGAVIGSSSASAYGTNAGSVDSTNANIGVANPSVLFDSANASIGDEIVINHTNSSVAYYVVNISTFIHGSKDGIGGIPRYFNTTVNVTSTPDSIHTGLYKNKIVSVDTPDMNKTNLLLGLTNDERLWLEGDEYRFYGGIVGQTAIITNPGTVYINIYGYSSSNQMITYQDITYNHD